MKLLKILDNGVAVYWDGAEMTLTQTGVSVSIPLSPRSQIELVEVLEEIAAGKHDS